jgi:hypothetical protein
MLLKEDNGMALSLEECLLSSLVKKAGYVLAGEGDMFKTIYCICDNSFMGLAEEDKSTSELLILD